MNEQALLILCGLVESVISVGSAAEAYKLNGLLRIAAPLGKVDGASLCSLPSCVHHVVDLLLRPSRLVPHPSSSPFSPMRFGTLILIPAIQTVVLHLVFTQFARFSSWTRT